jgi:hypothetical protein
VGVKIKGLGGVKPKKFQKKVLTNFQKCVIMIIEIKERGKLK